MIYYFVLDLFLLSAAVVVSVAWGKLPFRKNAPGKSFYIIICGCSLATVAASVSCSIFNGENGKRQHKNADCVYD